MREHEDETLYVRFWNASERCSDDRRRRGR